MVNFRQIRQCLVAKTFMHAAILFPFPTLKILDKKPNQHHYFRLLEKYNFLSFFVRYIKFKMVCPLLYFVILCIFVLCKIYWIII